MRTIPLSGAVLLALGIQGSALADSMEQRLARLEATMAEMQQRLDSQQLTIQQQAATIAEQKTALEGDNRTAEAAVAGAETDAWYRSVEMAGVIEVEAGHHDPYEVGETSDIVLATFELAISARLGDWVEVGGSLLYEEDETPLEVDLAYATFANSAVSPFFLTAGQIYVPFGLFETYMVSDPLTLEIGETRETALQAGFEKGAFNGSLYLFNGTNDRSGRDRIGSWGANLGYVVELQAATAAVGVGWISDIGDSDTLQDVIGENLGSNEIADRVGGWTVNAGMELGAFNLIGEYLAAAERFDAVAVPWRLGGAKPAAWNLEVAYNFALMSKPATVALAYQGSREALALELPRERWLLGIGVEIFDATSLSFEWAYDTDYAVADGGSGGNAGTATAQLALEF